MSRIASRFIKRELKALVSDNVINSDTADRIRKYYEQEEGKSTNFHIIAFSVLGAILVGSGIILLLAHNWENLSRTLRALISISPLLAAQVICAYAILKKQDSMAWRESASTFLILSIGIAISLVSQTYHIPGRIENFFFTWILLSIPLVYLLNATFPAVLVLVLILSWAGFMQDIDKYPFMFWPLTIAILPYFYGIYKKDPDGIRFNILLWSIVLFMTQALAIMIHGPVQGMWIIVYSLFLSILFIIGNNSFFRKRGLLSNPPLMVGSPGIVLMSIIFTYKYNWENISRFAKEGFSGIQTGSAYAICGLAAVLLIIALYFFYVIIKQKKYETVPFGGFFILACLGYLSALFIELPVINLAVFNIYLFAIGIFTVVIGIREFNIAKLNYGMIIIALLIINRFFDSSISFVLRGIVFVVFGIGFLLANVIMIKRKKGSDG